MAESYISDRIKFNKKGLQRDFMCRAKEALTITWTSLAKELGISQRTMTDWSREKLNMSYEKAQEISKLSKVAIPKDHIVISWNAYLKSISKQGGKALHLKYGKIAFNEENRKERWKQWWEKTGKYKKPASGFVTLTKIKIPHKDKILAEFIGIMLGDGGLTNYYASITLSSEEKGYILFVTKIIRTLFGVTSKVYKHKEANAVRIVVNSKNLTDFCQEVGLIKGNKIKHQIDIPNWVKENKEFSKVCVRGLVDTDGCFYRNSYQVNGKKYTYFKICFTSASAPLIKSVSNILMELGLKIVITKTNREVRIVDAKSVLQYIKMIGSHNQKHLDKIKDWKDSIGGDGRIRTVGAL